MKREPTLAAKRAALQAQLDALELDEPGNQWNLVRRRHSKIKNSVPAIATNSLSLPDVQFKEQILTTREPEEECTSSTTAILPDGQLKARQTGFCRNPTLPQVSIAFGKVPLLTVTTFPRGTKQQDHLQAASISIRQVHLPLPKRSQAAPTSTPQASKSRESTNAPAR